MRTIAIDFRSINTLYANYIKFIAVLIMLHVYLDNYHIRAKITHMLSKINTYIFYTFKVWNLRQCQISIEPTIFWCWINKSSLQLYPFVWWWQLLICISHDIELYYCFKSNPVFCFHQMLNEKIYWLFQNFVRKSKISIYKCW